METLNNIAEKLNADTELTCTQSKPLTAEEMKKETYAYYGKHETISTFKPAELPRFVYNELVWEAGFTDDLSNATIYFTESKEFSWNCGKGALINYETGLLVLWI